MSKMNAVARVQLAFQMSTFLQKYRYHQSQYKKKNMEQQMSGPDSSIS